MIKRRTLWYYRWSKRHKFTLIYNQRQGINQLVISATQSAEHKGFVQQLTLHCIMDTLIIAGKLPYYYT